MEKQIWQADVYRRPLQDRAGQPLWELVVCKDDRTWVGSAFCPQAQVNSVWISEQLRDLIDSAAQRPTCIQVFRPQAFNLIAAACEALAIAVEPTRHTSALKAWLRQRASEYAQLPSYTGQAYDPVAIEQPPPLPLPPDLWGDRWQFVALAASSLEFAFGDRPIPIREMPDRLLPNHLQIASTTLVPGAIIYGGKQSMRLARWLQEVRPVALHYIPGAPDGLILEAGLVDRWVMATFDDPEAIAAAQTFAQRLSDSKGLHFLLVQPDDSNMTYSGIWFLQSAE